MVSTRLPQRIFAQHTLITDQRIHDGLLERMAHMQAARHVRRRDHDTVAAIAGVATRFEIALFFPVLVHRLFNGVWIKRLFHLSSSVLWECRCRHRLQRETQRPILLIAVARLLFL